MGKQTMQASGATSRWARRDSGIELVKILAILLIAISHSAGIIAGADPEAPHAAHVFNVNMATTDPTTLFLALIMCLFGGLGNDIFFIASAWFLVRSSTWKKRKWLFMLVEIWVVSVIILVVMYFARGGRFQ